MARSKPKSSPKVSDALRRAIAESGQRLYDVARSARIPYGTLSHFMAGERVLTLPDVDRLCRALDLELRPRRCRNQPTSPRTPRGTLPE